MCHHSTIFQKLTITQLNIPNDSDEMTSKKLFVDQSSSQSCNLRHIRPSYTTQIFEL
jgi:hypothetical protein